MATHTAVRTVYRLPTVSPTPEAMFEALNHQQLDRLGAELHHPVVLCVPAIYLTYGKEEAADTWCAPNARTTGITVFEPVRRTGALLLLAVDGQVYAVTCGNGYRLVPDALKDKRFGLRFAIRMIDPRHISGAVTKALGRPRTDISLVAAGTSVPALGIRDQARVVRHLGGHLDGVRSPEAATPTAGPAPPKVVSACGSRSASSRPTWSRTCARSPGSARTASRTLSWISSTTSSRSPTPSPAPHSRPPSTVCSGPRRRTDLVLRTPRPARDVRRGHRVPDLHRQHRGLPLRRLRPGVRPHPGQDPPPRHPYRRPA